MGKQSGRRGQVELISSRERYQPEAPASRRPGPGGWRASCPAHHGRSSSPHSVNAESLVRPFLDCYGIPKDGAAQMASRPLWLFFLRTPVWPSTAGCEGANRRRWSSRSMRSAQHRLLESQEQGRPAQHAAQAAARLGSRSNARAHSSVPGGGYKNERTNHRLLPKRADRAARAGKAKRIRSR
jgi:hypothetical protein